MQSQFGGADTMALLALIVGGLGVVIAIVVLGKRQKAKMRQQPLPGAYGHAPHVNPKSGPAGGLGKRCPTCRSIYTDETLAFCLSDGSTLELVSLASGSKDTNATYAYPTDDRSNVAPTVQYNPSSPTDRKV